MNSSGFAKPLHIHMGNTAFDWVSFCNDDFPADLFSGTLWTIDNAFQRKFFDGHKMSLELEDERWKQFHVIVSSTFDQDPANTCLKKFRTTKNSRLLSLIPHPFSGRSKSSRSLFFSSRVLAKLDNDVASTSTDSASGFHVV